MIVIIQFHLNTRTLVLDECEHHQLKYPDHLTKNNLKKLSIFINLINLELKKIMSN
jgi:hypothetical protein